MADGVARSLSRLCSRDGKICCFGDALRTIFLLLCLDSYFSCFVFLFYLFFFFFPCVPVYLFSSCPFACAASHLLLSTSTYIIVRVLSSCVIFTLPTPSRNSFVFSFVQYFFFRSSYFSGDVFCCCALVPDTLLIALDLPTLILERLLFLCLSL